MNPEDQSTWCQDFNLASFEVIPLSQGGSGF